MLFILHEHLSRSLQGLGGGGRGGKEKEGKKEKEREREREREIVREIEGGELYYL